MVVERNNPWPPGSLSVWAAPKSRPLGEQPRKDFNMGMVSGPIIGELSDAVLWGIAEPQPFEKLLRMRREALGFSKSDLARLARIEVKTVAALEAGGKRRATFDVVRRLAAALGVTPDWFHQRMPKP